MRLILLLFPFLLFSQNNYQVKYNMTTLFDGLKNYDAKLTFSNTNSCFEYKLAIKDTATIESQDENGNIKITILEKNVQKIYIDIKNKKIDEIKYLKTIFIVQDTLNFPNWNISKESKIINNHLCQKATAVYKGRNYEAWFTTNYPSIYGPWKLNGLPGLIILAYDQKKEVYFEAIEIIKTNEIIEESNDSYNTISLKQFEIEIEKKQNDIEEKIKAMGDRNSKFDIKFNKKKGLEIN